MPAKSRPVIMGLVVRKAFLRPLTASLGLMPDAWTLTRIVEGERLGKGREVSVRVLGGGAKEE